MKSVQHNNTVEAAAAIQDGAELELQLSGIQALSCIALAKSIQKQNYLKAYDIRIYFLRSTMLIL